MSDATARDEEKSLEGVGQEAARAPAKIPDVVARVVARIEEKIEAGEYPHLEPGYASSKRKAPQKADGLILTRKYLHDRAERSIAMGFAKAQWIRYCEEMIDRGFDVTLYEARETVSKYVTVWDRSRAFKVRFSNHLPARTREARGDCDFFVGRTHFSVTNTDQAIEATLRHFGLI